VAIRDVRMNPETGGMYALGKNPKDALGFTRRALGQALSLFNAPRNAVGVLDALPKYERALAFNALADKAPRDLTEKLVARTAVLSGRRFVRAIVSDKHSLEAGDDLHVLNVLREVLEATPAKVRFYRSLTFTAFEVVLTGTAADVKVGDTVLAKVNIWNSEVGTRSGSAEGGLHRLVCLNGMTVPVEGGTRDAWRHVGDVRARVRAAITAASARNAGFLQDFRGAHTDVLPAGTRADTLERVVRRLELPARVGTLANELWDADGAASAGDTRAGLVNALTRAAQSLPMDEASIVETAAGKLVTQGWGALS
jgi:hypothetical protein